jgi:uncharacterized membrane protein
MRIFRSGPLPDSAEFRAYEATLSGAAGRLLRLAEDEQRFRHRTVRHDQRDVTAFTLMGQLSALVVALTFGWWSYLLVGAGHAVPGTLLGVADLGALVGLFLRGGSD